MKKLVLVFALVVFSLSTFSQIKYTPFYTKIEFRDTTKFIKPIKIGLVTLTATATELNLFHNSGLTANDIANIRNTTSNVQTQLNARSLTSHTHSGTYEPILGNPSVSGYVLSSTTAGTRSWIAPPSGGGGDGTWGSITGTLSDQTDLQNALNAKLTAADTAYMSSQITQIEGDLDIAENNISLHSTELDDRYTKAESRALIGDTAAVLRGNMDTKIDFAYDTTMLNGVNITELLEGYGGVPTGADSIIVWHFTIGETSGAPDPGDSTVTHAELAGLYPNVYRDGDKLYPRTTATSKYTHFRFNSSTGTITVHPPFELDEQYEISTIEPVIVKQLSFETYESTLLTGLAGLWKFDETSGTFVADATGNTAGTTTGTVGVTAKFGRGIRFSELGDYARIPYGTPISVTGLNTVTLGTWINFDSINIANGQNLLCLKTNDANYWSMLLRVNADNAIVFYAKNSSGTLYEAETLNNAVTTGTWYHVGARLDGGTMRIYLNGVDVTNGSDTFTGTLLPYNDYLYIGSGSSSSVSYVRAIMDEPAIWLRALSNGELTSIYDDDLSHPF